MLCTRAPLRLLAFSFGVAVAQQNLSALYGPGLSPGAEIFYPSDPGYSDEVTQRWNLYDAPTYQGAIKPATETDVQHIITTSKQNNISFLATGRGHGSTSTLERLKGGVEIDMSNFRTVDVDAKNNRLTVGGSVNFTQLYGPLYDAGKMLPMGNSRCVGVLGASLGGTVGILQGILGMAIDYLESVRLVTATGDLIEVSKTENADLFWGLRGAGANFGIVTQATFRLADVVNGGNMTSIDLAFPGNTNKTIYEALETYDNNIPDELTLNVISRYDAPSDTSSVTVNAVWYGPEDEAMGHLKPFTDVGPTRTNVKTVRWTDWWTVALFGGYAAPSATDCVNGQYYNAYALGIKQTDPEAMESHFTDLAAFTKENPGLSGFFAVSRYPNAVTLKTPDSETAYPWRDTKAQITMQCYYKPNATLDSLSSNFFTEQRAALQKTSGYDKLAVYVNFAHGDEGPATWYSPEKLDNLTRLKKTWDSEEVFSWYQPVPLSYP